MSEPTPQAPTLSGLNLQKVAALVAEITDLNLLAQMLEQEKANKGRNGGVKIVQDRIDALSAETTRDEQSTAPDPDPDPEPDDASSIVRLVMVKNAPLGNGTRERGELIATANADGKSYDPDTLKPAKGVEAVEVACVKNNPHLVVIAEPEAAGEDDA